MILSAPTEKGASIQSFNKYVTADRKKRRVGSEALSILRF